MIIMAEGCYNMRFWIINGEKSIIFVSEVAKMDIQQLERFILKTEKNYFFNNLFVFLREYARFLHVRLLCLSQ